MIKKSLQAYNTSKKIVLSFHVSQIFFRKTTGKMIVFHRKIRYDYIQKKGLYAMFEMFITVLAAIAAALYGFSKSVFMNGPHRHLYRTALVVGIMIVYVIVFGYRHIRNSRIHKLNVDFDDYMYYEKYTSPLYRAGYFISYLIQNILFDYIYMRRNFNFCKGLDVYDDGVGEYYVKFRGTWYQYLKITLLRHRVSISKLLAFSATTKNEMILDAIETEEDREPYDALLKEVEEKYQECHLMADYIMMKLPHYDAVSPLFRKNLIQHYQAINRIEENEPYIIDYVNRKNKRAKNDVNAFKKTRFHR